MSLPVPCFEFYKTKVLFYCEPFIKIMGNKMDQILDYRIYSYQGIYHKKRNEYYEDIFLQIKILQYNDRKINIIVKIFFYSDNIYQKIIN